MVLAWAAVTFPRGRRLAVFDVGDTPADGFKTLRAARPAATYARCWL